MILVQLLEMMKIMFYVAGIIAVLLGVLLLLLNKKFEAENRKKTRIFAIVLIVYGVYVLTFGIYCVNRTIIYHGVS